jgi:DNA-binding LacI/PurR family transcriptional regulator
MFAIGVMRAAESLGRSVPDDVSIVGWDDSLISQVVHPPLTAITRDLEAYGSAATRHLLAAIAGERVGDLETERGELTTRGSTGRPRLEG